MSEAQEFRGLMARVLARSESAAQELLQRYEPYLLRAIRKRLTKRMRSKFDSLDFAQDVWASFYADLPQRDDFATPGHLAAFLAKVARNKVIDAGRQRQCQKCGDARERSLDDSQLGVRDEVTAPEPTPSAVTSAEEEWRAFLRRQPPVYRRVFVLLRLGETPQSIAQDLRISEKTVRRLAERLKMKLTS